MLSLTHSNVRKVLNEIEDIVGLPGRADKVVSIMDEPANLLPAFEALTVLEGIAENAKRAWNRQVGGRRPGTRRAGDNLVSGRHGARCEQGEDELFLLAALGASHGLCACCCSRRNVKAAKLDLSVMFKYLERVAQVGGRWGCGKQNIFGRGKCPHCWMKHAGLTSHYHRGPRLTLPLPLARPSRPRRS